MSHASWATVSPQSGSGSPSGYATSWTASANTGRSDRLTTAVYSGGGYSRTCIIRQLGASLFVNVTTPSGGTPSQGGGNTSYSAPQAGVLLTIKGYSNASKITYATQSLAAGQVDASIDLRIPSNYTIGGSMSVENGASITGDPGASAAFEFSIPITIPENTSVGDTLGIAFVITAEDESENSSIWTITIIQSGVEPYLYIGSSGNTQDFQIEIPAAGTPAQTVNVFSNTSWTIS